MSQPTAYSRLQIALHWLVAALVVAAWWLSEGMGRELRARLEGATGTPLHVWLGLAVFALVLVRVVVRLWRRAPPPQGAPALRLAAQAGHAIIYLLLLAVPASGIAAWYLGLHEAAELHETAGNALIWIAAAHAAIALVHQYVLKDGTLGRMIRPA